MKNRKKYLIFASVLIFLGVFLQSCTLTGETVTKETAEENSPQEEKTEVQEKKLTAQTRSEYIDITATVQNETEILVQMNNHQEDLSGYDLASKTTLDGQKPMSWKLVGDNTGGHHVEGILTFEKIENPKLLKLDGLPIGEAILTFTDNESNS